LGNKSDIKLVGRIFMGDAPPPFIPKAHEVIVQTVRGERGSKQYLLLWRDAYADCQWYESLSLKDFRKLAATLPVTKRKLIPIKSTPMNLLLSALGKAIYEGKDACAEGMDPKEWRFNLQQARKQLRKKPSTVLYDLGAIYAAIVPRRKVKGRIKQIICKRCHTPLLFGFILDGQKITHRRDFCGASCKVNWTCHGCEVVTQIN
jgi:hypothetical protein